MRRFGTIIAFTVIVSVGLLRPASATSIFFNDEAGFIAAAGSLGFESFEGLTATNTAASSFSATLASFTLTATQMAGVFDELDYAGTHAVDGSNYVEVEGGNQQSFTFTFSAPIHAFGLIITDYGDVTNAPMTYSTSTGLNGNALNPLTMPCWSAAGGINGAASCNGNDIFFGILDPANAFSSITLTTGSTNPFGDPFSVDAVRFSAAADTTAVPEPATLTLFALGLSAAVAARRRPSRT